MNTQPPDPSQAELDEILEQWLDDVQTTSMMGVTIDDTRTDDDRDRDYILALERAKAALTTWAERSAKRRELEARRDTISDMIIECHNERRRLEAKLKALEEKK